MTSPSDDELRTAVVRVRDANPDLGILKLWAALKAEAGWAVSEKRFRKTLAEVGGSACGGGAAAPAKKGRAVSRDDELVAHTALDTTIDVASIAPKVKVKMFGGTKGKGLVAKSKIEEGEWLWQEDPWLAVSDPEIKPHLVAKRLCTHCLTQWPQPNPPLSVECSRCSEAHFCNRLCAARAKVQGSHVDLLCEGVNPACERLNKLVAQEWRSLDAVARILALWLAARGTPAVEVIEKRLEATARINMRTRESEKADWKSQEAAMERRWKAGHEAILQALRPADAVARKKIDSILRKVSKGGPVTDEEESKWFSYDNFLDLLGMVNINLESSGGLYALHAHMNHSCEPNIQVRNLPKHWAPPESLPAPLPPRERGSHKLTMIARRPIHAGEDLSISYVDFSMPRDVRRQALRDGYGFWCECPKCVREVKAEKAEAAKVAKLKAEKEAKEAKATEDQTKEVNAGKVKPEVEGDAADDLAEQLDQLAVDDDEVDNML